MAKEKNSALTWNEEALIQILGQARRAADEGHEQQALKELSEWYKKWEHTEIGEAINNIMSHDPGKRRPRGPAFDKFSIVLTLVFLEKIGIATPAAKKQVAERFCTTVRNVELYLKKYGAGARQIFNLVVADEVFEFDWDRAGRLRLTQEEVRKLKEINFREK